MGAQVMEGLFQHESIRMASIGHPDSCMLALKIRPPISLPTRWLTDPILHQDRQFSIPLIGKPPYNEYYGELRITLTRPSTARNSSTTPSSSSSSAFCAPSPWGWCSS